MAAAVIAFAVIAAAAEEQVLAFAAPKPVALAGRGVPGDDVFVAGSAVMQGAVGAESRIGGIGAAVEASAFGAATPALLAMSYLGGKRIIGAEMVHMRAAHAANAFVGVAGAEEAPATITQPPAGLAFADRGNLFRIAVVDEEAAPFAR